MTNIRKVLLSVLFLIIIGIAGVIIITSVKQKRDEIREQTTAVRALLEQSVVHADTANFLVKEKEQLLRNVKVTEARFYREGEIDAYSFGLELIELFQSLDLGVIQYHAVAEKENTLLEYTLSGPISNTLEFLQAVSANEKYWNIDFLSIKMRPDNRTADITIRIGYETIS